ncbi:hypothetical protein AVEN_118854-1 [Araneus ventricosus]|uniref:Uncharacterized protein n=1 Tax=Araneus ventricosus TaxID=182803 RepID=A0A4Y2KWQ1_ARAVE|nr:hypothetical protein AVEN_191536-1 [Araneus ventricosus]GBN06037.1 hypothetical protein AVEN_118854-1 [Araneus ventricosus]
MSREFLATEEAFDCLMLLADESDDCDPDMIILQPDPNIVPDDKEIHDACTSIEHDCVIFYEKLQEETAGTIVILRGKMILNLIQHLNGLIVSRIENKR